MNHSLALVGALTAAGLVLGSYRASARDANRDPHAEALIADCRDALHRTQVLRADVEVRIQPPTGAPVTGSGTIVLKRPNLARMELKGSQFDLLVSDGKTFYTYSTEYRKYMKADPGKDGLGISTMGMVEPVDLFWGDVNLGLTGGGDTLRYVGREKVDGREYEAAEVTTRVPFPTRTRYYFSPADHLLYRVVRTSEAPQGRTVMTSALTHVRVGGEVEDRTFQWSPPAGAELFAPQVQPLNPRRSLRRESQPTEPPQ